MTSSISRPRLNLRNAVFLLALSVLVVQVVAACGGGSFAGDSCSQYPGCPGDKTNPAWSPDGRTIAFDGAETDLIDANGSNQRSLGVDGGAIAWSPDGKRLAYLSYSNSLIDSIYVASADGKNARQMTRKVDVYSTPSWSPDGRVIAFSNSNHDLYLVGSDSRHEHFLRRNGEFPAWSPNGQEIAFNRPFIGGVRVINAQGGHLRRLTFGGYAPSWSPDGRKIAFYACDDNGCDVHVMNADGSHRHRLNKNYLGDSGVEPGQWGAPAWSPDGRKIAFVADDSSRQNSVIYIIDADGARQHLLTN